MSTHSKLIKISLLLGLLTALFLIYYQHQLMRDPNLNILPLKTIDSSTNSPQISYQETIYDFGVLDEGAIAKYAFSFINLGTAPLIIYEVVTSCNLCTTATWPPAPIQPGEKGTIQVTFNSAGRQGKQGKYLIVRTNTDPAETRLLIRGIVKPRP